MPWKVGWSAAAAELVGRRRKMARLGGEGKRAGRRAGSEKWRALAVNFGIGSDERWRISDSAERLFWASQKIGQEIGPLLERWFLDFYPKLIFGSVFWSIFWALLKMLTERDIICVE